MQEDEDGINENPPKKKKNTGRKKQTKKDERDEETQRWKDTYGGEGREDGD